MNNKTIKLNEPLKMLIILFVTTALFLALTTPVSIALPNDSRQRKNSVKLYSEDYINLLRMIEKSVKMSLQEYNALLEDIRKAEEKRKKEEDRIKKLQQMSSAQKYTFTSGRMDINFSGTVADLSANFKVNMIKEGWKEIPLEILNSVDSLLINGKTAPVKRISKGRYRVFYDEKGTVNITFRAHPKINTSRKGNRIFSSSRLEFNQRCSVDVRITLPKGAEPSSGFKRKVALTKKDGIWTAASKTDFTSPLNIEWYLPSGKKQVERPTEITSNIQSYYITGRKLIRLAALVNLTITGKRPETIGINLPKGFKVTDKELPTGLSLKTDTKTGETRLRLHRDLENSFSFIISVETKTEADRLLLIPVSIPGARRELGHIAVKGNGLIIKTEKPGSYDGIDTRLIPGQLRGLGNAEPDLAFMYNRTKTALEPAVVRMEKLVTAESIAAYVKAADYAVVLSGDGVRMTEANINLINNNKQYLKVSLPGKSEILSAYVDDKPVKPVSDDAGNLLIPIRPKKHARDGLVKVGFVYKTDSTGLAEEGEKRLVFPKLDMPVNFIRTNIYLPKGYEYNEFTGNMKQDSSIFMKTSKTTSPSIDKEIIKDEEGSGKGHVKIELPTIDETKGKNGIGSLTVTVTTDDGQVLPSATVTISSKVLMGVRTLTTGTNGRATFRNLPIGKYSTVITMDGFQSLKASNISVFGGGSSKIIAELEIGEASEVIAILDTAPLVDTSSNTVDAEFDFDTYTSHMPGGKEYKKSISTKRKKPKPARQEIKYNYKETTVKGALPINVQVPKTGMNFIFHGLLFIDERPYIEFEYEKE